jgi:DNA topoisomerase-1
MEQTTTQQRSSRYIWIASELERLGTGADEFKEQEHPREKQGPTAGQFTAGSGGSASSEPSKSAHLQSHESRESWPEHIKALKIPPAWTDVKVASDPSADLLAIGVDKAGRKQYVYSEKFAKTQAAIKFARIQSLEKDLPMIEGQLGELRKSTDQKTMDLADCTTLIMKMGIRPGSDDDTKAKVQAYGATTLQGKHVVSEGGKVRLVFTGKKGVAVDLPVEYPDLAKTLAERAERAGEDGEIFSSVNDKNLREFVRGQLDGFGYSPKDFRTRIGTVEAQRLVSELPVPTNEKEYRKAVLAVAKQVAQRLGNTPVVALTSYIAPQCFADWRQPYAPA